MIENCFHDPDVLELVRKQWRADERLAVADRYGNVVHLLRLPAAGRVWLVSPYQAGIELAPTRPAEVRADNLFEDLVERLVALPFADLSLEIRVASWFFDGEPHALLEPFLAAGFEVRLNRWQRVVDLTDDAEVILASCSPMVRRKLRQGAREPVKVRTYFAEPAPESVFRDLYDASRLTREASVPLRHPVDYFTGDRRRLVEQGKAVLTVLEHGDSRHYVLAFVSRDIAFYVDGATSGDSEGFENHLAQYRTMLFLKEIGCLRYSVGTIFPDLRPTTKAKAQQIARFKHGLGSGLSPTYSLLFERRSRGGAAREGLSLAMLRLRSVAGRVRRRIAARRRGRPPGT